MKTNNYLTQAKRLFTIAKNELSIAQVKNDTIGAQQAAEKGYLSLLKVINALLIKKGVKEDNLPKNEHYRKYYLKKYTDREFRRTYAALRYNLHINAFLEGLIDFEELNEEFADLKMLIDKVERKILNADSRR